MNAHLQEKDGECHARHLPGDPRNRVIGGLKAAGMTTECCPTDARLVHVTLPPGWDIRPGTEENAILEVVDANEDVLAIVIETVGNNDFALMAP